MTTIPLKDQIVAELDQLPEATLTEILAYVQSLKPVEAPTESAFWQGYQRSKQTRGEVYRRLADS